MDINRMVVEFVEAGRPFAVGLVLSAEGSTPREAGVKAVMEADGRIHGTLGGGAVEAEAQRRAIEACKSGRPIVFEARLAGEAAASREPLCGGEMRVLVDPTAAKDVDAYRQAAEAIRRRERGLLLTIIHLGDDVRTEVQWRPQRDLADEEASLRSDGDVLTLTEPIIPRPLLIIAGGGHVGQAVAVQGDLLGFDVLVLDDRPEFADPALFPTGAETRCGDFAAQLAAAPLGPETYVVIVTRGHQHDAEALRACIDRPLAYLGMIGSRRKVALLRQSFLDAGRATEAELDRVHAPIGLDLGAETVPEIAVAIAAELVAIRRRGESPGSMRKAGGR